MHFSVIIPVASEDDGWSKLLPDLIFLKKEDECIFVSPNDFSADLLALAKKTNLKCNVRWIYSEQGRAKQQNIGAKNAKKSFLWFVHCDSRINVEAFDNLKKKLAINANHLYYFNLKFLSDGPRLMLLNEFGVFIRSNLFKIPFGDQAFCLRSETFFRLYGFDENANYGEDHLLIWKAHQRHIPVKSVGISIYTSARRYDSYGWSHTTGKHLLMTFKQAVPQFKILLKGYLKRKKL